MKISKPKHQKFPKVKKYYWLKKIKIKVMKIIKIKIKKMLYNNKINHLII